MLSSVPMPILDEHPTVSIKKPTRQWDAWTRQEEENFFNALRQVGKNFEKITCRVQSKNKDQVRHYYYRVIKRMNKLLGPGLVLDARNSKEANTAMLSWWSLLEKHSCSASKLHLKPRRFKIFVTALEHQLLKDRKKTRRKRVPSVESLFIQPPSVGTAVNVSVIGSESESVKLSVSGEAQTTRKIGAQRGSPAKRKSIPRKPATSSEGTRPPRQRRKVSDVSVSLAAFKRWEKAAIAGVTLMAEAAEHLEKAAAVEQMERLEETEPHMLQTTQVSSSACDVKCRMNPHISGLDICASNLLSNIAHKDGPATTDGNSTRLVNSRKCGDTKVVSNMDSNLCTSLPVSLPDRTMATPCNVHPSSSIFTSGGLNVVPILPCNGVAEIPSNVKGYTDPNFQNGGQKPGDTSSKLKLQLFPIDIFTRQTLEQDGLNPHLELTLKGRKSITSILQHLISKWGKSSIAAGELRLFPFDADCVDAASCESWNFKDVSITAADVHKMIGSPVIFRLRYGWLSSRVLQTSSAVLQEEHPLPSAITDLNASSNLDDGKALVSVTTLQSEFSVEKNPVESNKLCLCDAAEVGKDAPLCAEQVSPRPAVAGLANSTPPSLTPYTVERNGDYYTSTLLQGETKENTPELGMQVNKLLSQNDDGCQKLFTQPAVVSSGPVSGVDGIRTECIDTQLTSCSWLYEGSNDGFAQCLWSDEDPLRYNGAVISPSEVDWVDSFTNISIGELLNQVSQADCSAIKCEPLHFCEKSDMPPLECLKAVQPQRLTTEALVLSAQTQQRSSILGAEDTCDSFSFQRIRFPGSVLDASSLDKTSPNPALLGGHSEAFSSLPWRQANSKEKVISEKQMQEISNPLAKEISNPLVKDVDDLRAKDVDDLGANHIMPLELYLADSLGALDMSMNHQSEGHQGQDLFLNGDSSLGFSGLIGVLGQGNMDSLLGLLNQNESSSMYREEKHSLFLLSESSNKEHAYQGQP